SHANESTDRIFASYYLTHRLGILGHKVSKGPIMIGVKSPFSQEVKKMQLMWSYQPEKVSNGFLGSSNDENDDAMSIFTPKKFNDKLMVAPEYEFLSKFMASEDDDNEHFLGARRSYVPTLGTRLWWVSPAESFYHAYIFETQDHKLVGYVRI